MEIANALRQAKEEHAKELNKVQEKFDIEKDAHNEDKRRLDKAENLEQVRKELRELEPARPPPMAPLLGAAAAGSMVQVGPGLWGFPGQTCPPLLPPGNAQATRDDFFEPPRKRRAHRDDYSRPARRRLEPDHGEEFEVYEARTGARPFHARGREDRFSDDDDDYELFEQAQRRSRAGREAPRSHARNREDRLADDEYELFEQAQRRSRAGRFPRHSYSPGFED